MNVSDRDNANPSELANNETGQARLFAEVCEAVQQ